MARTKQTARMSTGGKAPRKQLNYIVAKKRKKVHRGIAYGRNRVRGIRGERRGRRGGGRGRGRAARYIKNNNNNISDSSDESCSEDSDIEEQQGMYDINCTVSYESSFYAHF